MTIVVDECRQWPQSPLVTMSGTRLGSKSQSGNPTHGYILQPSKMFKRHNPKQSIEGETPRRTCVSIMPQSVLGGICLGFGRKQDGCLRVELISCAELFWPCLPCVICTHASMEGGQAFNDGIVFHQFLFLLFFICNWKWVFSDSHKMRTQTNLKS